MGVPAMDNDPITFVCRCASGSDLVPLLVVVLVFLAAHALWRRFMRGSRFVRNLVIVAALVTAVVAAVAIKQSQRAEKTDAAPAAATTAQQLPRLVDLGADKCIPCKMMAPILEVLKKTQAGRLDVEFIDVWKNEGAGEQYEIRVIPTQIFFAADGKELFRHEGFFSKEDIIAKWKEFGVELTAGTPQ
jgi:thioredoxin 1